MRPPVSSSDSPRPRARPSASRFLLQWAVLAPSRHNTQPWTFEIEGDELRVYADLSRVAAGR